MNRDKLKFNLPIPEYDPLTQDEVDALEEGTRIIVLWSGGNGPSEAIVGKYQGLSYTTFWGGDGKRHLGNRIDFVGSEKMFTKVWLPNKGMRE